MSLSLFDPAPICSELAVDDADMVAKGVDIVMLEDWRMMREVEVRASGELTKRLLLLIVERSSLLMFFSKARSVPCFSTMPAWIILMSSGLPLADLISMLE